ncbi:MAG TPA: molecular chaperone TorD family protein [Pyrinomonadaceae bacterium]|jgi:TorA maturation chaperone TorD|nr:molecular chaperone TorD family protein [Pyrinomonadaceae bacterium]
MELFRALAVIAEPPVGEAAPVAAALELGALPPASAYTELFAFQLYPYASVYLGAEGMLGGAARDLIAGFWRALKQTPPAEPDYLPVMLALYAHLCELEDTAQDETMRAGWRHARRAFLWEHLLSWLPVYLEKLSELAPPFYQKWGELLRRALLREAAATGGQDTLSLHLRESAGLSDPRANGLEPFLQTLLSPARSGMILTRADLTRAARTLNLGTRIGERLYIIKALFGQDAAQLLEWLAQEATRWAGRHRSQHAALSQISQAWTTKAEASAALLRELKLTAQDVA